MTGSRALFYIERHRIQDAKLHDAILANGNDVVAQAVSAAVAKRLGLSDAEIVALQRTPQRDDFVAAEHPRASAGSPRGTGGEFVSKSIKLHGNIHPIFLSEVKKAYRSAPKKMQELLKDVPMHIYENMDTFRKDAKELGYAPEQIKQVPNGMLGIFTKPNPGNPVKVSTIGFIQKNIMETLSPNEGRRVVLHEMVHAVDRLHLKASDSEEFKDAFRKDIQNAVTLYKDYDAFGRNIINFYSHYLNKSSEAFAESGARYLSPSDNESDQDWFNTLFPNINKAAVKALNGAGIIKSGGETSSLGLGAGALGP